MLHDDAWPLKTFHYDWWFMSDDKWLMIVTDEYWWYQSLCELPMVSNFCSNGVAPLWTLWLHKWLQVTHVDAWWLTIGKSGRTAADHRSITKKCRESTTCEVVCHGSEVVLDPPWTSWGHLAPCLPRFQVVGPGGPSIATNLVVGNMSLLKTNISCTPRHSYGHIVACEWFCKYTVVYIWFWLLLRRVGFHHHDHDPANIFVHEASTIVYASIMVGWPADECLKAMHQQ